MSKLDGKAVAILATDGFEEVELTKPLAALKDAGAKVHVIAPEGDKIRGWDQTDWGQSVQVDVHLSDAQPEKYDALVLPGGQINPDVLRVNKDALSFIRTFFDQKKPLAAICHAPWLLIETGIAKGRELTSYHSIKTDVINAGGQWRDEEVVVDEGLVTSRNPGDLDAFCAKIIEEIAEGRHADRKAA